MHESEGKALQWEPCPVCGASFTDLRALLAHDCTAKDGDLKSALAMSGVGACSACPPRQKPKVQDGDTEPEATDAHEDEGVKDDENEISKIDYFATFVPRGGQRHSGSSKTPRMRIVCKFTLPHRELRCVRRWKRPVRTSCSRIIVLQTLERSSFHVLLENHSVSDECGVEFAFPA